MAAVLVIIVIPTKDQELKEKERNLEYIKKTKNGINKSIYVLNLFFTLYIILKYLNIVMRMC